MSKAWRKTANRQSGTALFCLFVSSTYFGGEAVSVGAGAVWFLQKCWIRQEREFYSTEYYLEDVIQMLSFVPPLPDKKKKREETEDDEEVWIICSLLLGWRDFQ